MTAVAQEETVYEQMAKGQAHYDAMNVQADELRVLNFALSQALHTIDASKMLIAPMPETGIREVARQALTMARGDIQDAQGRIAVALAAIK